MTPVEIYQFLADCRTLIAHSRTFYEARDALSKAVWLIESNMQPVETTPAHCIDCIELKNALAAAVKVANEARECHDRDQDMRTMKLLIALSGHLPKWRADTDRIHDVLRRAVERLSAPMPPEEPACTHPALTGTKAWKCDLCGVLCEDCPPVGYPTDETRCTPCPRSAQKAK